MPRRRLASPDDKRSAVVGVRLSPGEKASVEDMAAKAGMSPAEFARQRVLTGRVIVKQTRRMDAVSYRDLNRVGTNLNQLVRWLNIGGPSNPKELDELKADGTAILAQIATILAAGGDE